MKRLHDFLFGFMILTVLAGVFLAFSNPGRAASGVQGLNHPAIVQGVAR